MHVYNAFGNYEISHSNYMKYLSFVNVLLAIPGWALWAEVGTLTTFAENMLNSPPYRDGNFEWKIMYIFSSIK
jgi:hypothetical protein